MTVLLTQRTAHLTAHAGQISFPGGRIEAHDPDPESAALRETEEEVGLPRDRVSVIGRLDTYLTGTGFEITPVVGIVTPPFPLAIDPFEVAEAFEVPLSYILDRRNHQRVERQSGAHRRVFLRAAVRGPQYLGRHRRHPRQPGRGAGRVSGMLRVLLTVVLPLLLPTAIYVAWIAFMSWSSNGEPVRLSALPLVWLALAGVVLLALVLVTVTVHFGEPADGRYVPPRYEDGRVIPPHVEPLQSP